MGMGIRHGGGGTRQCGQLITARGRHACPPFSYDGFEESDVLIFIGSICASHHPATRVPTSGIGQNRCG
jgi:assimilatory nitrate reductase catalytic subunit